MNKIFIGSDGTTPAYMYTNMLNRHTLIAGATGTGKTITLKVLAEQLSKLGIPSFMADIKGDLSSLIEAGTMNSKVEERLQKLHMEDYENRAFPVEMWDVYGEKGLPLRTTVSSMGPVMLSRILGLNEVQEGIMNILFRVSDEAKLLLIDLKDLKAMLTYLEDHRNDLQKEFGTISSQSIGAIRRALLVLENQGADKFFGEPELHMEDLIAQKNGQGIINILFCDKLFQSTKLYSGFLFWLLSELYEHLPEVGDLDQPKIVFFFDEAHVLFEDGNKMLMEKIELITRLIRSKGVGICFITQNPTDIPDTISSQIGNRIQHGLRAYSPKEKKVVKAVAELFPGDTPNLEQEILNLGIGEALVSFLDEKTKPSNATKITVAPPESKIGTVDPLKVEQLRNNSPLLNTYAQTVNNFSAYEALEQQAQQAQEGQQVPPKSQGSYQQGGYSQQGDYQQVPPQEEQGGGLLDTILDTVGAMTGASGSRRATPVERAASSMMSSIGRELGRELIRGIFGTRRR